MNDYLLLILGLPPAILSFIHLIKIIKKYRNLHKYKKKDDGDVENNFKGINKESSWVEIRHSEISFIFYVVYIVLIVIVTLNTVNVRSEKRFKGYELNKLREEFSQLEEEINLIRAENSLILSEKIEDLITVVK